MKKYRKKREGNNVIEYIKKMKAKKVIDNILMRLKIDQEANLPSKCDLIYCLDLLDFN